MTADATSSASHPKRLLMASGKLLDASNSAAPALSAHKHAIEVRRADKAAKSKSTLSVASPADLSVPTSTLSSLPITVLQLRYGLPLYAYLICQTGTFIFSLQ